MYLQLYITQWTLILSSCVITFLLELAFIDEKNKIFVQLKLIGRICFAYGECLPVGFFVIVMLLQKKMLLSCLSYLKFDDEARPMTGSHGYSYRFQYKARKNRNNRCHLNSQDIADCRHRSWSRSVALNVKRIADSIYWRQPYA